MTHAASRAPLVGALFDALEARWESAAARRLVAMGLALSLTVVHDLFAAGAPERPASRSVPASAAS